MAQHTLPNGIILDDAAAAVPTLREHIERKGLALRVFLATHPNGRQEYLLVDGTTPVFTDTAADAVWAHIDIEALSRDFR